MSAFDPQRPRAALAAVSLSISGLYVLAMLVVTDAHFVPQVSDLYLIAQYAKGFAEGHPFQYNPGEAPTAGATSLLHTLLLGLAHLVGFRGEGLIAFAILSGAAFSLLTVLQAHRAGETLSGSSRLAFLGALLVALNGPLAWSFHYGADIALVLFLSTWLFAAWIKDSPASTVWVLPAALLALTRPEAAVLVLALAIAQGVDARTAEGGLKMRAKWFTPLVVAMGLFGGLRLFAGETAQSSYAQKLLSTNWGEFAAATFSVEYWSDLLRGVLLGFYPADQRLGLGGANSPYYAAPFLLVFVFLALLQKTRALTRASWFLVAALLTAVAVTPTIHMGVHSNRYLLFALPPLLLLSGLGIDQAARLMGASLSVPTERVFRRLAALACIFGVISVARFALVYADSAAGIYKKDEALFDFIRTRLPEKATYLSNGVSIEYRTERRSLNLSGVVTPGFALILPVETEASAFEVLSRPETGALPPYLIAHEAYIEGSPAWAALVGGAPVFSTSGLDGAEFAIYPTRADLVGRQRGLIRLTPGPEWAQVDSINVADPVDERDHGYRYRSTVGVRHLYAALKIDRYQGSLPGSGTEIADGGRIILGHEEMRIATPRAGDVLLVMRTHGLPSARVRHPAGENRVELAMAESAVRISTSRGRSEWFRTVLEPGWNEVAYKIPAALVEGSVTRLRLEGRYAAYWYAAFQATSP